MLGRSRRSKLNEKSKPAESATKNKTVPKVSELRRLIKAAYPERWKIAGK